VDCPALRLLFIVIAFILYTRFFQEAEFPVENEAILSIENGDGSLSSFEVALHFHCFSPFLGI